MSFLDDPDHWSLDVMAARFKLRDITYLVGLASEAEVGRAIYSKAK